MNALHLASSAIPRLIMQFRYGHPDRAAGAAKRIARPDQGAHRRLRPAGCTEDGGGPGSGQRVVSANSYLGDVSSPVTLAVQFASLPDGTNYPAQKTLNASAKGIQLAITNSNYQKLAP